MTINKINVYEAIENVKALLKKDRNISPALRAAIEVILMLFPILANRVAKNSSNSSKPPSSDPNRKKIKKDKKSKKKPGGQNGHVGTNLKKVDNPDRIKTLKVNKNKLPPGNYKKVGYKTRQVIDVEISRIVTEYRAEVLEDEKGNKIIADFPKHVTKAVQYGNSIKAHSVYMSNYQLIPYNRIQEYFSEQIKIPISTGTICNFNKEAYGLLETFEKITKEKLISSELLHADETGINVNGKRIWLHNASNDLWTHFHPHFKRGSEAIDDINIIPNFKGTLCHDHWKPYYRYDVTHSLCNAHHLRELKFVYEIHKQKWAKKLSDLLLQINKDVDEHEGKLPESISNAYRKKYRSILKQGEKECPLPEKSKKGRIKKGKPRNLLERLQKFESDTLRFMENKIVPFTNNQGENDIRMTKVQQKISGCFRSIEGAYMFCRIRGYLTTCKKHGVSAKEALDLLFKGKLPEFIDDS